MQRAWRAKAVSPGIFCVCGPAWRDARSSKGRHRPRRSLGACRVALQRPPLPHASIRTARPAGKQRRNQSARERPGFPSPPFKSTVQPDLPRHFRGEPCSRRVTKGGSGPRRSPARHDAETLGGTSHHYGSASRKRPARRSKARFPGGVGPALPRAQLRRRRRTTAPFRR